jgi:D-arabinose 1-dehydrogenase-like Zn-dependent alcohol dehydrogenase
MFAYEQEVFGAELFLRQKSVPQPRNFEVLIKVVASALCHTDRFIHQGTYPIRDQLLPLPFQLPFTAGHEVAGIVEAVGEQCKKVKSGDQVIIYPWHNRENMYLGCNLGGGFASHLIVPHEMVKIHPK